MIEQLTNLTADARQLLQAVVVVVAIGMTLATWAKTKSAVATVGSLMLAVFVIWGVNNVDFLQAKVDEDLNSAPPRTDVVEVVTHV